MTEQAQQQYEQFVREHAALRDQFAAAALTGLLASPPFAPSFDDEAKRAYSYADAMLRQRAQPTADAPAPASTAP
jgi:hypothetical protein